MRSIIYDKDPFSVVAVKAYDSTPKMSYYDSWRGLITPINGVYQQAFYNNGIAVGDKIYFQRSASHHSHWNADSYPTTDRFFCYDTTNNTLTSKPCLYNDQPFHMSSLWEKDGIIYGFGYPYRYKTTDLGDTWQREDMTAPQYDPCPVFKLRSGRIIGTMLARTKYLMITDDNGLTWQTISPFSNFSFVTTMTHGTICELNDCVVLYFNCPFKSGNTDSSKRYVSVSYDDGDTWTEPKLCVGDLQIAGRGIAAGGFGFLDGKYHFIVGNRYEYKKDDSGKAIIGDLRWYVGTAADVKNGTMLLRKVLAETKATNIFRNMSSEDTGNGGVCFCNGALYCNWGNLIYNRAVANQYMSNQGIEMYRIGLEKEDDAEPYWNTDYVAKFNALAQAASHQHNYYFYGPNDTNLPIEQWYGNDSYGYAPNVGKFVLPMGEGDFEINCVVLSGLDGGALPGAGTKIAAGYESVGGELHGLGKTGSHKIGVDMTSDSSTSAGSLPISTGWTYLTIKRESENLTITANGVTLTNPEFGWDASKSTLLQGVEVDSFVCNLNATDEQMQTWINSKPSMFNVRGIKMLVIDCNPNYPPRPTYTITNNLTNCTTDNADATITEGQPYSATITGDPYTENLTVVCTMGGVAQTVDNGVIYIAEVTGDIVITATADIQYYITAETITGIQLPFMPNQLPKITGWLWAKRAGLSAYNCMLPVGGPTTNGHGFVSANNWQFNFQTRSWNGGAANVTLAQPYVYLEVDLKQKSIYVENSAGSSASKTWTDNNAAQVAQNYYASLLSGHSLWRRIKVEIGGEVAYDFVADLDDQNVPCLKDTLTGTCYYDPEKTAILTLPPQ